MVVLKVHLCWALVFFESQNRGLQLPFDADGWFAWNLDPGDYVFSGLWCQWGGQRVNLAVQARFTVAPQGAAIYIGHFAFNDANGRFGPVSWAMNEAEGEAQFARRYPAAAAAVPQEPTQVREPGKFNSIRPICASEWGLQCGIRLQGVEPIYPPIEVREWGFTFAALDTPAPTLKWKSPAAAGISYDVAVWEAVAYRQHNIGAYSRGRLALYAEDIRVPQFAIPEPLKPNAKYFWSVRLRAGDVVSTWSLGGNLTFAIIAASFSSGQWFAFETP